MKPSDLFQDYPGLARGSAVAHDTQLEAERETGNPWGNIVAGWGGKVSFVKSILLAIMLIFFSKNLENTICGAVG